MAFYCAQNQNKPKCYYCRNSWKHRKITVIIYNNNNKKQPEDDNGMLSMEPLTIKSNDEEVLIMGIYEMYSQQSIENMDDADQVEDDT